ncbi:GNAT family N-acetyltransferase [Bacillus paranthracis]|uniref:GNAT family N-acetyltransferase n=1 Tax=Bacillus paranthracis TaxID=2026186 RepID=UPI0013D821A5|nr:GNAT family protein [Bacillus paranthracis]MDK7446696.1 GNAT family protein [Bacillus paranthracis]MDN8630707.1 GNAT family protein [Bacillus paranthracis]MDN8637855.1 GNAT family protein [Bacillus paranthracis]HDR7854648.1 GNAT family N-acetyltransferase [Bacillus paranthracis]
MKIRIASVEDAEYILSIKQEIILSTSFFVSSPSEIPSNFKKEKQRIEDSVEKGGVTLIAEIDNAIVGFLSFSRNPMERLHHVGSFGMGIKKEFCNYGIGTKMLSYLINWAKAQKGLEKICLGVLSNNKRAIHVYKKLGFQEEGRQIKQIKFENGEYADDILMALHLKEI